MPQAYFAGIGCHHPERILSNADLERLVDTTDDWITTRTGIKERRIAADDECTSDLALPAARQALAMAGVAPEALDLILVATASPDQPFPSTACNLQAKLRAGRCPAFDITAACSGFIYGITIAQQFIESGKYGSILVVGAEKISAITDWTDRNTCVLFGDGAGAVVLRAREGRGSILSSVLAADGTCGDLLNIPAGGTRRPLNPERIDHHEYCIRMSGREVFKLAVIAMQNAAIEALETAGVTISDIACIIPHQANMRIVDAIADRLGVPVERFFINLQRYGNTSAASIPVALAEAVAEGRVRRGDKVLLTAFGGGLTWAAAVIEW
jgi:3-oxoacyl-[acyl-carrier-protein] synthase-3